MTKKYNNSLISVFMRYIFFKKLYFMNANIIKFARNLFTILYRKEKYKTTSICKLKKKNDKLIILGNAFKIVDLEFTGSDLMMLNNGPFIHKINPDFHLFELPLNIDDKTEFLSKNSQFNSQSTIIFRPNSIDEKHIVNSYYSKYFIPTEMRIVFPSKIWFLKFQLIVANFFNIAPYFRSSISFAVFLANYLNYKEVELIGFDPYNKKNKFNLPHATSNLIDGTNVYEFLKFCRKNHIINYNNHDNSFTK